MRAAGRVLGTLVVVGAVGVAGVLGGARLLEEVRGPRCEFRLEHRVETLAPEQAANAATISMVAVDRGLPPRAVTIALATAIQESKLRNLTYGDADSLGLFQQRPSQGWGTPEEVTDPVYAANAFYDVLVQVPDWQDGVVTEVAQEVQRSAFPEAYADHEWEGRVLASVLTGHVPAGMGCRLDPAGDTGSAGSVLAKASETFGADGRAEDRTAVLEAADQTTAWAIASWAVAHAEAEDVVEVRVGDRRWSREDSPLTWSPAPATEGWQVRVTVG